MARTAIVAVNNVLRLMREPTVSSFSSAQNALDGIVLSCVNRAARTTLYSREWEFMKRWGELVTRAPVTGTTGTITNADTAITLGSISAVSQITGNLVGRLVNTGDSEYGNSSFKIVGGVVLAGNFVGSIETAWPGTTDLTLAYTVYFSEYLLPESVAGVYQVLHEERPVTLEHSDEIMLHRAYPRLWETTGEPEVVAVGGSAVATYDAGSDAPEALTRLLVYPVPDDAYVLRYQYLLRFTELSAATDAIPNCPDEVWDRIEELAYHYTQTSDIGNDPEKAALVRGLYDRDVAAIHMRSKRDKGRRFIVPSFDSVGRMSSNFGVMPDDRFGD